MKLHDLPIMGKSLVPDVHPEWCPGYPEQPDNKQWKMWDGQSSEVEVIEFLYSLVRLVKPKLIVETGPLLGYSTVAMMAAQDENGFGKIKTIEINASLVVATKKCAEDCGLDLNNIEIYNGSSLDVLPTIEGPIDLFFSDSDLTIRGDEIEICLPKMSLTGIIAVHDTSPNHLYPRQYLNKKLEEGVLDRIHFPSSRGFSLAKKKIGAL